jgi:DNA mismatch repair protein MutL
VKNKYILTPVKSGLMVIDQRRAHERVLYESFMKIIDNNLGISQRQLFPAKLELSAEDSEVLSTILDKLRLLGFDIKKTGDREFFIDSVPGMLSHFDAKNLVEKILNDFKTRPVDIKEEIKEHLAEILAGASAINHGTSLKTAEIGELFDNLFACQVPKFSPSGKNIITIMQTEEFDKLLK